MPSCTRGGVWLWCSASDSCGSQWGEKPSPEPRGTGSPGAWGKILYAEKRLQGFSGRTQERGETELLLLDWVIFVKLHPDERTRRTQSTNKALWCLQEPTGCLSPGGHRAMLSPVTLSMAHRLCSHLLSFMNVE